jgi:hypothetical protein
MSPPGSVQPAATPGLADAVLAVPACLPEQPATLELLVLLAQPAAARLAAASRVTLATPVRLTKHLIGFISYLNEPDLRRIGAQVFDERFGEALDGEVRRAVGGELADKLAALSPSRRRSPPRACR